MKRLLIFLGLSITLVSCEKWQYRDCEKFYLCGQWSLQDLAVNGKRIQISNMDYRIGSNQKEYGPHYYTFFQVFSDSAAYYYDVNGVSYPGYYNTSGSWSDNGDYLLVKTEFGEKMKSSRYPGFLGDYTKGNSTEKWYYVFLDNNNMILSNSEFGSEIVAIFSKVNDGKCACYFDY